MTLHSGHPDIRVDDLCDGDADDADNGFRAYLHKTFKLCADCIDDANGSELTILPLDFSVGDTVDALFAVYWGVGEAYFSFRGQVCEDPDEEGPFTYLQVKSSDVCKITPETYDAVWDQLRSS